MILTAVGLILWVQETYAVYETWAYAWALAAPGARARAPPVRAVPRRPRASAGGLRTLLVGLGLFFGFALFFEGALGLSGSGSRGSTSSCRWR